MFYTLLRKRECGQLERNQHSKVLIQHICDVCKTVQHTNDCICVKTIVKSPGSIQTYPTSTAVTLPVLNWRQQPFHRRTILLKSRQY